MYEVKIDYKMFSFDTLSNAMAFVGMVLNSAKEEYDVTISKDDEGGREDRQ